MIANDLDKSKKGYEKGLKPIQNRSCYTFFIIHTNNHFKELISD